MAVYVDPNFSVELKFSTTPINGKYNPRWEEEDVERCHKMMHYVSVGVNRWRQFIQLLADLFERETEGYADCWWSIWKR
jgi:hypothetical protein